MNGMSRARFIFWVTASYAVLALAWIFLSDRLLEAIADRETLISLSVAKGVFFVIASAGAFFFALRAVPAADMRQAQPFLDALAQVTAPNWRWRVLMYVFAVAVTLAMLVVSRYMLVDAGDRPLLILYMLPIILSALMGGLGPGLVASATAALGADLIAVPHFHAAAATGKDQFQWALLLVNGLAVSLLSHLLRRSLARLEHSRSLLDAVVSGTSDAVFVKDRKGRYLLLNEAAIGFAQKPLADVLGRDDTALFDLASAQELARLDQAIMASAQVQTHEERLTTHDGRVHVFQVTKGPVFDAKGQVSGLFGISRDITQQQRAEVAIRDREQQLARVIDGSDQGYWDWDLQTDTFQVSARWEAMLGYAPGEMKVSPEHWPEIVHPEDLTLARASIKRHLNGESPNHEVEIRCRSKQGAWCWILSRGRVVSWDADGKPLMMSGTHTDITERKLNDLALREAGIVFDSSYEGIMVVSPQRLITKINPAFTRITGYSVAEAVGQSPKMLASGQHGAAFYQEMWRTLEAQGVWRGEVWNRRKNGDIYAEILSISVVRDAHGQVQHYVGVFADISHLKAHEAELDRVAHYDPLTGLPNRRLLSDRLSQSIIRSLRSGKSSAVCFLDLDGFKQINDQHGHAVGDLLLIGVAENLKSVLRADDTLARLGGDEFVLILSEVASPEECTLILDRILEAASSRIQAGKLWLTASASIGVSLYPQDNVDADTLLRHADQAMYLAKEAGKNRYHLFDPESDRKAQTHRQYLELLRQALARREFVLYYQPKVDLVSGSIIGAEALIRWRHPERGLLPPAEFLPHLHGSELEKAFGEWVIHAALSQAAAWRALGLQVRVSVNVSANHLLQDDFCAHLGAALTLHPSVAPAQFELEVLETAAIGDMQQAVEVLNRCKALGVQFALDDFGTGYSSLTYLRKLPVDTLKIDQSFVRDMLTDADDHGIVEGVIQLASAFKRQVIAEGVETLEHGRMLRRMGCRLAQGYGIARPMPAEQFPAWCAAWQRQALWLQLGEASAPD